MPSVDGRHTCPHPGCGRSFARKEHLARHSRSHKETNRYTCEFCSREFTRSDSLQRHRARHGDSLRPRPSGRSKHACVTCHASKIKCDGNKPCAACLKKGFEDCSYELQDQNSPQDDPALRGETPIVNDIPLEDPSDDIDALPRQVPANNQRASPSLELPSLAGPMPRSVAALRIENEGGIDWFNMMIERDSPNTTNGTHSVETARSGFAPTHPDFYPIPKDLGQKYLNVFYGYFHHRWPIIHSPSLEQSTNLPLILSCMKMMGAWLSGTQDAKWLAIAMHERITAYLIPQLLQLSSRDTSADQTLITLCQASLYNVIFALYCGSEVVVSRAVLLKNILVTALREISFFNPETTIDDPKIFLPMRILKHEERQRLAAYLFKIDGYLSALRFQPPVLTAEDLHYALPSTYALHNSNGLHIFDTRYSIEPAIRSQTTICHLIQVIAQNAESLENPTDGLMLPEDIQLGICSLQSRLYHLSSKAHMPDFSSVIELNHTKQRLEVWKQFLDRIEISYLDASTFGPAQHWAMRFYYGMEDHSKSGWKDIVYYRKKSLVCDGVIFYHLSNLQLYSNIRILSQLSEDLVSKNTPADRGDVFQQAHQRRVAYIKEWVKGSNSRRAVHHAAIILGFYNDMPANMKDGIDPMVFMALSMAALVVWSYTTSAALNCEGCALDTLYQNLAGEAPTVELTLWNHVIGSTVEEAQGSWVETGRESISIGGTLLCRCTLSSVLLQFKDNIPEDWDLARTVAPGIFEIEEAVAGDGIT